MRLELLFELEKNELPKDNKSIWVSYLKYVLSNCNNGKYFEQYFSKGKSKDYTFSMLLPSPVFSNEKILLKDNKIKMLFSADDRHKTGLIFYSAFIANKNKNFILPNGNAMVLKGIRQRREPLITDSRILFKMVVGGGLVVRKHNPETNRDFYFTFEDENFTENAERVLMLQAIEAGFSEYDAAKIKIKPIKCRKALIKQYGIYVDVTLGVLEIESTPEMLKYFYQAGLGSKRSMGYGMIDLIL